MSKKINLFTLNPRNICPDASNILLKLKLDIFDMEEENKRFKKAQNNIMKLKEFIMTIDPKDFSLDDYYTDYVDYDIHPKSLDTLISIELFLASQYNIHNHIKGNKLHLTDFLRSAGCGILELRIEENKDKIKLQKEWLELLIKEGYYVYDDDEGLKINAKKATEHNK